MSLRSDILRAWVRILQGRAPVLSIEITKRCPLNCPGCYAFAPGHVNGQGLEDLSEFVGDELVASVLELVRQRKPLGVFIVGGEPLVRHRELDRLLPELTAQGINVEVVTSAVRPIPTSWAKLERLSIVISVDGPRELHDERRKPATYDRILKNIQGHRVIVHCTVTRQVAEAPGGLEEFFEFWSSRDDVKGIRISLYTPQVGEVSEAYLPADVRRAAIERIDGLARWFPKVRWTEAMAAAYREPPGSPENCVFAQVTDCVSADLASRVEPCQIGGTPDCRVCGCVAAIGLKAVGDTRLLGPLRVGHVFQISRRLGRVVASRRKRSGGRRPENVLVPLRP
ncbi:MAG: hypothetical protein Kow00109_04640 [Acidobacteriota bacterium]